MGERIKIKDIEGDADVLASLFASSDCSLGKYLNADKNHKIGLGVFIGFIVFSLLLLVLLWIIPATMVIMNKILIILSLASICGVVIAIHLYWEETFVTFIGLAFFVCLFLISIGAITPEEAGERINDSIETIYVK